MRENSRNSISEKEFRMALELVRKDVEDAGERMRMYGAEVNELIDSYRDAYRGEKTITKRQVALIRASIAGYQGARIQFLSAISGYLTSSAVYVASFPDSVFAGREKSHRLALNSKYENLVRSLTEGLYEAERDKISKRLEAEGD